VQKLINQHLRRVYLPLLLVLFTPWAVMAASIAEFTQGMNKQQGFYTIYYDEAKGKVYVELDRLNQPFIFQSSMPKGLGSNDIGLDRGQMGSTRLVEFAAFGNKVLLKQHNTYFRSDSSNLAERDSVNEAFASSVIAGFKVVAGDKNQDGLLIDYTDYLLSDVHGVSRRLSGSKQGSYSLDKNRSAVYMPRTKSFVNNTEFEALITYKGSKPGKYVKQVAPDPYSISLHLHHSFIELPDDNYQPRVFDPNSGFMSVEVKDYAAGLEQPMIKRFIPRHRLSKKNKNAAVSEAVEPIIYYLDPGVPEPVRTALLDGGKWWDQAFSAIGYRNAFQVKILPADADPMDVRYNVIQWVHRATRGWSYGSSVVDPRTGEIIKGHVTLGSLRVRQDLLIAQGMTAAFSGQPQAQVEAVEMALDRIRQLSAHEIGHTIGLAHNFAASGNSRASVMDYPHPLMSLDDNGDVVLTGAYDKGIGQWDKHSIAYGYSDFAGDEVQGLASVMDKYRNSGLDFISDPDSRHGAAAHPNSHLWDNGADPIAELNRMVEVRQVALEKFGLDALPPGASLSQLQERLAPIYLFHRFQVGAVAKLVGGLDYSYEVKTNRAAQGSKVVAADRQKAALAAMLQTLEVDFLTLRPELVSLILPKSYGEMRSRESFKSRTDLVFDAVSVAEVAAAHSLKLILNPARLNRVSAQQVASAGNLTVEQLLEQVVEATIKAKPAKGLGSKIQQRLAHVTLEIIMQQYQSEDVAPEVKAEIFDKVLGLTQWLEQNPSANNRMITRQIDWFERTGKWQSQIKLLKAPPGSPI